MTCAGCKQDSKAEKFEIIINIKGVIKGYSNSTEGKEIRQFSTFQSSSNLNQLLNQ